MDNQSTLISVDNDDKAQRVALGNLGDDSRFTVICADGGAWLEQNQGECYDFIFADAWPGKFSHIELALNVLNKGGMYIIDGLLPQDNWPEGHAPRVPVLISQIENMPDFTSVRMEWASGLMLVIKS
jgi:predicted O-methyltransferase YrrM